MYQYTNALCIIVNKNDYFSQKQNLTIIIFSSTPVDFLLTPSVKQPPVVIIS